MELACKVCQAFSQDRLGQLAGLKLADYAIWECFLQLLMANIVLAMTDDGQNMSPSEFMCRVSKYEVINFQFLSICNEMFEEYGKVGLGIGAPFSPLNTEIASWPRSSAGTERNFWN